jgi:uncharacterized tellurite resistance protein B-like protein
MPDSNLILTLGKVIVAAAWADGDIANDEVNNLKDLLFHLPNMSAAQWAPLEMYIEQPVGADERSRLVEELRLSIGSDEDRRLVLQALDELVAADGQVTVEERAVLDEVRQAMESAEYGLVRALSRLVRGPMVRHAEALFDAPNREDHIADFIHNKVFYNLQQRLEIEGATLDIGEEQLRKLAFAGGMMAYVAHADGRVDRKEFDAVAAALQDNWGLGDDEAALVAEVALDATSLKMERLRLARGFFDRCTQAELVAFLDVLFDVAAADGMATIVEIEEIRAIARSLLLTHKQFIEAKLKLPRERRET